MLLPLPTPAKRASPAWSAERNKPGNAVPCSQNEQRGQALVETLVFALIAVVLLIGVLAVGRLQAIHASTVGAARAYAFECRFELLECDNPRRAAQLSEAIRSRHFGGVTPEHARSATRLANVDTADATDRFWVNADRTPMVRARSSIEFSSRSQPLDAGANVATIAERAAAAGSAFQLPVGPQQFGLDARQGLRVSAVEVPVALALRPSQKESASGVLSIRLKARLAIVGNEWNASQSFGNTPDSVQSRVERGSRLDSFREAALDAGYVVTRGMLHVADAVGLEPGAASLTAHRLDISIVPGDRRP